MFRQGLLFISGILILSITALLIAGFLYAQKGKAELAAIQSQLRAEGARITFEDLDIEEGEVKTKAFIAFGEEVKILNSNLSKINEQVGDLIISAKKVGLEFHVQKHTPQQFGIAENTNWDQVYAEHQPLREQWELCYEYFQKNNVRYQPAYETGPAAQVPQVSILLNWAKSAQRLVLLEVQRGNLKTALNYLDEYNQVHRRLMGDRVYSLIEALVDVAADGIMLAARRQILNSPDLDKRSLTQLRDLTPQARSLELLQQSIEGERILFGGWIWERVEHSHYDAAQVFAGIVWLDTSTELLSPSLADHFQAMLYRAVFIDYDHAFYLNTLWSTEKLALDVLNNSKSYFQESEDVLQIFHHVESAAGSWQQMRLLFTSLAIPAIDGCIEKMIFFEVFQRQMNISLYLEEYHLQNQAYPRTLAELPISSDIDLRDPITLESMKYKLEDNGSYTLYSIGLNAEDDGAPHLPFGKNEEGIRIKEDTAPDWIWPKVLTE